MKELMRSKYRDELVDSINEVLKSDLPEEVKGILKQNVINQLLHHVDEKGRGCYRGFNWYMEDGSKSNFNSERKLDGPVFLY